MLGKAIWRLRIQENLRRPGLRPRPRWGSLQRSCKPPSWWEGAGCPFPKNPIPRSRPFGPRLSILPTPELVPTPLHMFQRLLCIWLDSQRAFVCCWSRFCLQSCVLSSSHALKVHYRWSEQFNFDRFKKICVILVWMSLSWWAVGVGGLSP